MSLDHVFRDARLSDLEAELEQFAMDAARPTADSQCSSAGSASAGPCRFVAGPQMNATSSADAKRHEGLGSDDRDGLED